VKKIRFLFFFTIVYSQWASFDNNNLNLDDKNTVNSFAAAISTFNVLPIDKTDNFSLGSIIVGGVNNNYYAPIFYGQTRLTWNLFLRGRMSVFSSNKKAVQLFGWGLSLNPNKEESLANWLVSFDSGFLSAHNQIDLSAMKFSVDRLTRHNGKIRYFYGFSLNLLSCSSFQQDSGDFVRNQLQSNHINIGTLMQIGELNFIPNLSIGNKINYLSISLSKNI
tara:strand:- start:676 stop:1338 length:663 start_codon:yes stop_codon:yes gene_type:complete